MRPGGFRILAISSFALSLAAAAHAATPIARTEPLDIETGRVIVAGAGGESLPLENVLPDAPAILHFWATWCAPCRAELPELDGFASDLGATDLGNRLVVISVDRGDYTKIETFLRDRLELEALSSYQDASGNAGATFRLFGFPSTVHLDADHRIVGQVSGLLEWADPEIRAALEEHLGGEL